MIHLFTCYPLLGQRLPYKSLCDLPTTVHKLDQLGKRVGLNNLYIKRDDLSGIQYGGNKPRKLEFILGKTLHTGAKAVMAIGGIGSNHALATAIYARKFGLKSISMLMPQPNASYVRRNLLMSYYCNAELHLCGTGLDSIFNIPLVRLAVAQEQIRHRLSDGCLPDLIPPGGSSPLGAIGFVNAGLELKEQILNGEIPEPDYIYLACGTMGTAAGLILGIRAAKLKSKVIPVRVTSERFVNYQRMLNLIKKTNALLHSADNSFPEFSFNSSEINIRQEYFGSGYAVFTEEGTNAVSLMKDYEGIKLEGTYTGKALAAIISDAENGELKDKAVLFWNTVNSRDFSKLIEPIDYHNLPKLFHRYFREEVQPLDRSVYFSH